MFKQLAQLLILCGAISGCSFQDDITSDVRFRDVVGQTIHTKVPFRLYAPDNRRPASRRQLYDLTEVSYLDNLVASLKPGHSVTFERAIRENAGSSHSEYLQGHTTVRGRSYPIIYYLGTSVYPNRWRQIFDSFRITASSEAVNHF